MVKEEKLQDMKDETTKLAEMASVAIENCMKALQNRDFELSDFIIRNDKKINELYMEIENKCIYLIALEQPVATDLRLISSTMSITNDLERIGDYAVNIAKINKRIKEKELVKPLIDLPRMKDIVREEIEIGMDFYKNMTYSEEKLQIDDIIDDLNKQVFNELVLIMMGDPKTVDQAGKLMLVGRHLERAGDHAINIANRVNYIITGDIRYI
ncbi:phosphate transport system regulatory protein PhoU [Thermococci archaeon]|nr:MAG: phosphate transport system regulatory protein PhoU [Thermococci archaeon]